MKRRLFTFALAALTIGLLGSCSKINERIDGLDKRVYDLENGKIASIDQQIAAINQSIADLGTIRTNIQNLKNEQEAQGQDITALKAADITLEGKINDLKTYVDTELSKYATKDWANATFATLEQHQWTCDTIAKIDARIGALDAKLSQSISGLENSLKKWVNEQLDAYYTAAQMDAKLGVMQSEIDALKNSKDSERIDSLATELTKTKAAVDTAKANIRTEYKNAIDVAINKLDGEIRGALLDSIAAVNARIEALDTRVTTLEGKVLALEGKVDKLLAMIQSVTIVPAYSDGSVEAVDGILTLKCIVSPAEAIIGMESLKDSLVLYADSVKVKTKATTPAYMTIKVSEASVLDAAQGAITLTADISEYLPKGEDKALTVAVNIKNGISDYTTEFVPVYEPSYVEIKMTVGGQEKTYKWAKCNIGATKETDYGDYYAWGTTVKAYSAVDYSKTTGVFTFVSSNPYGDIYKNSWDASKGFNWVNTPFTSGVYARDINQKVFTKYVPKNMKATYGDGGNFYDDKIVLDSDDDVAHKVLGGNWRMPTEAEFKALCSLTKEWKTDYKGSGVNGYLFTDADGNSIFLPAAGQGAAEGSDDGTVLSGVGGFGYYWSSSLYPYAPCYANNLRFSSSSASMDFTHRFYGRSVRAISE